MLTLHDEIARAALELSRNMVIYIHRFIIQCMHSIIRQDKEMLKWSKRKQAATLIPAVTGTSWHKSSGNYVVNFVSGGDL